MSRLRKGDMELELEYWPASSTKEYLPTSTKASTKTSTTTTREWLPQAAQDELRGSVDSNGYWEPPYDKMD